VLTEEKTFQLSTPLGRFEFLHELYNMCLIVKQDGKLGETDDLVKMVDEISEVCKNLPTLSKIPSKSGGIDGDQGVKKRPKVEESKDQVLEDSGFVVEKAEIVDFGEDNDCIQPLFKVY
jgi:hypothetical protein